MKKILLLAVAAIFALNLNAQIFSDDFQDADISDWTTVTPTFDSYNTNWHTTEYEGNYALRASCYDGTNHATEQWIISPSFSTDGFSAISMDFNTEKNYGVYQDLELYVSTDFAGDSASFASATWTQITGFALPTTDEWVWFSSTADLSTIAGNPSVYIAFKYVSTADAGGVWDVDDVVITGTSNVSTISKNINIYPNPATTVLNIQSATNINTIVVTNVIGQRVMNVNNINSTNHSLNVEDFANGVYLINVENTDGTSTLAKFVKK